MKRYAISDIHGCLKSFQALLRKVDYSKADELYLLGDYTDRGPDSKGVIDYIWQLQSEGYQVFCLRGNHDQIILDITPGSQLEQSWLGYGGVATLKSFGVYQAAQIPQEYLRFFETLPYYFEVDRYILVHAGLNFQSPEPLKNTQDLMWIRNWYHDLDREWLNGRIVVHGHTPSHRDDIKFHLDNLKELPAIVIDNGCVYKNYEGLASLCAFELTEQKLIFQAYVD